eukprot:scaffold1059_cov119-Isochrysis_galbana.AAC.2
MESEQGESARPRAMGNAGPPYAERLIRGRAPIGPMRSHAVGEGRTSIRPSPVSVRAPILACRIDYYRATVSLQSSAVPFRRAVRVIA